MSSYADTSFMVSLYVPDAHSPSAIAETGHTKNPILITPLCEVELCNAIELSLFRKEITGQQAKAAAQAFEQDIQIGFFTVQPITPATFEKAKRLARQHTATLGIRTLDLLHVAAALTSGASTFFSFDIGQRKLARAAGLTLRPKTV